MGVLTTLLAVITTISILCWRGFANEHHLWDQQLKQLCTYIWQQSAFFILHLTSLTGIKCPWAVAWRCHTGNIACVRAYLLPFCRQTITSVWTTLLAVITAIPILCLTPILLADIDECLNNTAGCDHCYTSTLSNSHSVGRRWRVFEQHCWLWSPLYQYYV